MKVGIKQATKEGFIECSVPGAADLSYPTSCLRRGRVQGGVRKALQLQQLREFARL